MDSLESLFEKRRALVVGVGGCGDVVSTIPTARLLEGHGVDVVLGGVAWERIEVDPQPGPRHFDDIEGIDRLNGAVAIATGETRTHDGIEFAETQVARHYDDEVVLLDLGGGVKGVEDGLAEACAQLDIDLVVGTDAGGDVLAAGDEPGIKSPLTDALMLAVLSTIDVDASLGVFGYGSDGELTLDELAEAFARAAGRDGFLGAWGLTPRVRDELERLLDRVTTDASRLPVEVARGELGDVSIRDGARSVELTPASVVTFYFDPVAVAATSDLDAHVRGTTSLVAAQESLAAAGYDTELDLERRLARER